MKFPIFNIFHRCKVIIRLWSIQEARKRRIEREFQEAWEWNNRKFIKKYDRQLSREIDKLYDDTEMEEYIAGIISSQTNNTL